MLKLNQYGGMEYAGSPLWMVDAIDDYDEEATEIDDYELEYDYLWDLVGDLLNEEVQSEE